MNTLEEAKTVKNRCESVAVMLLTMLAALSAHATEQSPYAGQEQRPIKSLSAKEIDALRKGRGMGFAKLAELNGYPGPKHVLELADALALSDAQLADTRAVFRNMQHRAIKIGEAIVEAEQQLDAAFAENRISPESLEEKLSEIGALQAELRYVHLEAHLRQKSLLSPEQVTTYNALRGYRLHGDRARDHSTHRD